jgi:MerR family transcriptional regulator, light-induced transcriptional regulator
VGEFRESPTLQAGPFGQSSFTPGVRQAIESGLVPRLLGSAQASAFPAFVSLPSLRLDEAQIREFVRVLLADDEALTPVYVSGLRARGIAVESIYLDLLAPAARLLGEMWDDDSCGFMEVTVALGRLQLVLRQLSQMFVRDRSDEALVGRVLLACVPGEQHSLGLFMVAEFFIRDGWGVHVGPPLEEPELLADVRREWYDVVGFSVACNSRIDRLKREIARVRKASKNRDLVVLAGGRAFNDDPGLVARVGADASVVNAELAPECARQLIAR